MMQLRSNHFRRWLASHKSREIVGFALDGGMCPIANYLIARGGYANPSVDQESYEDLVGGDDSKLWTPVWAREFINRVDRHRRYSAIRTKEALRILDEVTR